MNYGIQITCSADPSCGVWVDGSFQLCRRRVPHTAFCAFRTFSGDEYDDEFEIDKEDWFKAIGKLRNLANLREDERENITSALQGLGCTVEEAIELFEAYIRESDQGNYYMHFRFL